MRRAVRLTLTALGAVALMGAAPGPATGPATLDLGRLAGDYRYSFPDALMTGQRYTGHNVLQIVKLSPTSAYFETTLDFANGHQCGLSGVARAEGAALVYRGGPDDDNSGGTCVLSIQVTPHKLVFEDAGTCAANCGARGSFGGISFARSLRRPIRDPSKLLNDYSLAH